MLIKLTYMIAVAVFAIAIPASAYSESYPSRPIRLIVPFSAGVSSDFMARTVGQALTDIYKRQVVVDNRPGAGGLIGGTLVATASPDGYTLGLASTSHVVGPLLQKKPPYRPIEDFTPVAQLASVISVLVAAPNVPAKTVQELVALAKAKPGALNYASIGAGTAAHISAEVFNRAAGINVVHVPFKTAADVFAAMVTNQVHYLVFVMPAVTPMLKDGRLRALAVTGAARSTALPDVPTVSEAGLPAAEVDTIFGIVAPAVVPKGIVAKLHQDIVGILRQPETAQRFATQGAVPTVNTTPENYSKKLRADYERYRKLIQEIGLEPQ